MTSREEITALAAKTGATIKTDADGRIASVQWNGKTYGGASMATLIDFAEKARAA